MQVAEQSPGSQFIDSAYGPPVFNGIMFVGVAVFFFSITEKHTRELIVATKELIAAGTKNTDNQIANQIAATKDQIAATKELAKAETQGVKDAQAEADNRLEKALEKADERLEKALIVVTGGRRWFF